MHSTPLLDGDSVEGPRGDVGVLKLISFTQAGLADFANNARLAENKINRDAICAAKADEWAVLRDTAPLSADTTFLDAGEAVVRAHLKAAAGDEDEKMIIFDDKTNSPYSHFGYAKMSQSAGADARCRPVSLPGGDNMLANGEARDKINPPYLRATTFNKATRDLWDTVKTRVPAEGKWMGFAASVLRTTFPDVLVKSAHAVGSCAWSSNFVYPPLHLQARVYHRTHNPQPRYLNSCLPTSCRPQAAGLDAVAANLPTTFRGLHAAALAVRWAGKSLGVRGKDEKTSWEHEFHATARHHDSGDTSDLAAIIVYTVPALSLRSTRSM